MIPFDDRADQILAHARHLANAVSCSADLTYALSGVAATAFPSWEDKEAWRRSAQYQQVQSLVRRMAERENRGCGPGGCGDGAYP